jgi:hypothetical protein
LNRERTGASAGARRFFVVLRAGQVSARPRSTPATRPLLRTAPGRQGQRAAAERRLSRGHPTVERRRYARALARPAIPYPAISAMAIQGRACRVGTRAPPLAGGCQRRLFGANAPSQPSRLSEPRLAEVGSCLCPARSRSPPSARRFRNDAKDWSVLRCHRRRTLRGLGAAFVGEVLGMPGRTLVSSSSRWVTASS